MVHVVARSSWAFQSASYPHQCMFLMSVCLSVCSKGVMEPMQTLLEEDCASLHRQGKEYWRNQTEVYSVTDKLCQVGQVGR